MNKYIKYLPFFLLIGFLFAGCTSKLESRVVFKNIAAGALRINFRGTEVIVPAGKTVTVDAIKNGVYSYATTYDVPAGATSATATGDVSGNITINAGTRVLIIYSSTFIANVYQLYATMSSSDDLSGGYSIPL